MIILSQKYFWLYTQKEYGLSMNSFLRSNTLNTMFFNLKKYMCIYVNYMYDYNIHSNYL